MPEKYLEVRISAENDQQVAAILDDLLENKLVTGGQIISAPAKFIWKGKIVDMDYRTITAFTIPANKQHIINQVKQTSQEEVPMIWFTAVEVNPELANWIDNTVRE